MGGTVCHCSSGFADWLPISIFRHIMATTLGNYFGQFSCKFSVVMSSNSRGPLNDLLPVFPD